MQLIYHVATVVFDGGQWCMFIRYAKARSIDQSIDFLESEDGD